MLRAASLLLAILVSLIAHPSATLAQVPAGVVGSILGPVPDQPPAPPRDAGGRPPLPTTGTAVLRGRVVDDAGVPLAGAKVRLRLLAPDETRDTTSGGDGRFEFRDLPARPATVAATRTGYVSPGSSAGPRSRSVSLKDGEAREVTLALVRPGAIVGTVVGPDGEPLVDAAVQAMQVRRTGTARRMMPVGVRDMTDDRGTFRLHSLAPGNYCVSVQPPGRFGFGVTVPGSDAEGMAPTFYPATTNPAEATPVPVTGGGEASVTVQVAQSALFTVSGRVVDAEGNPIKRASVQLRPRGAIESEALSYSAFSPSGDGSFEIRRVPPGAYRLVTNASFEYTRPSAAAGEPPRLLAGESNVEVYGDVTNVVLRATLGATVRGRVIFSPTAPEQVAQVLVSWLRVEGVMAGMGTGRPVHLADDGTFELTGVRGRVALTVSGGRLPGAPPMPAIQSSVVMSSTADGIRSTAVARPAQALAPGTASSPAASPAPAAGAAAAAPLPPWPGILLAGGPWRVDAVRAPGREVVDGALDVPADGTVDGVELTVVRDWGAVTGVVRDADGTPQPDAMVVALPAGDQPPLTRLGSLGGLRSRAGPGGRYFISMLGAGTYDLVALPSTDEPVVEEDEGRWREGATRVRVAPLQRVETDLVVTRP